MQISQEAKRRTESSVLNSSGKNLEVEAIRTPKIVPVNTTRVMSFRL